MGKCVAATVVGFLLPMCITFAFIFGCWLTWYMATNQRRKAKVAHEQLICEKDAFRDQELQTHKASIERLSGDALRWRKEAEMNRAASDSYKRLLESHGIQYERATMLFSPTGATAVEGQEMLRSVSRNSMLKA